METFSLGEVLKTTKLETLSRQELIQKYIVVEDEVRRLVKEIYKLRNQAITAEQINFIVSEQLDTLQDKVFGKSSEKYNKSDDKKDDDSEPKPPKPRIKKLSERYPNAVIKEQVIEMSPPPSCPCCNKMMTDSGMTEDSEQLNVIPKKYEILLQKRIKYRCSCQGNITTAPAAARIIPGSSYSDEMIQDVAMSKYCDLIPIERYVAMAERAGVADIPANSLIETTHQFADYVSPAYSLIERQILEARVLNADETPHRMLEGSDKKTWYLWGFSTPEQCFLECHDTRSGEVASNILLKSKCEILVSDVYAGYGKAIREANQVRQITGKAVIKSAYCNAHARRYFFKAFVNYKESKFYLDQYQEIYGLNAKCKGQGPPEILKIRSEMKPKFEAMKKRAFDELGSYPRNGKYGKALRYFLDHYVEFTLFLDEATVPIDNNAQERLLRSHVVGRKTWYGTHSKRGALTAAILFSLVESCKLNKVNPREYFKNLVQDLLTGSKPYTPKDYKQSH